MPGLNFRGLWTFLVLFLFVIFLSGCRERVFKEQGFLKDIPMSVIVVAKEKPNWGNVFEFVSKKVNVFDYRLKTSPLWELNRSGRAVLSGALLDTVMESLKVARESRGAFDPAIWALTRLWDFDEGGKLPTPKEIEFAKAHVDYREISIKELEGDRALVILPKGFGLDLGGIAKGEIVDLLADYLNKLGYSQFLIEAGGDILVSGLKIDRKWRIGIRHPRRANEFLAIIPFGKRGERMSIVTSGDYEQYFIKNGIRYNHIIDPRTGYPARDVVSVTVIDTSCRRADALSTAAFVLGYRKGLDFLAMENVKGLLVRESNGKLECEKTPDFPLDLGDINLN